MAAATTSAAAGTRLSLRLPTTAGARGAAGLLGLVLLIEGLPRLGVVDAAYFPPFTEMLSALREEAATSSFWSSLGDTVRGWALGLAIAVIAGCAVGMVIGMSSFLRAATATTIEFLRPIPSVALIPVVVLLYGTSMVSTLLLVVYASFWQIVVQVMYGVQDIDPVAAETARSYRFSRIGRTRHVVWPTTLPYAITGFRLAAAVALILEVTGELVIGSPGLGNDIALAQSAGAVDTMYALVLVTGLLGVTVNLLARAVEHRALHWHPSVRGVTA
ncbi:ABC transporter permease [Nocardioides sambongensis]|uniref:ABC transporter permease n=1 Tax=Nocardioides sambongensis TaxID=2589074 RepID=UPI00112EA087|nr:ABC transporter permease [Nocardioides sambongensis]